MELTTALQRIEGEGLRLVLLESGPAVRGGRPSPELLQWLRDHREAVIEWLGRPRGGDRRVALLGEDGQVETTWKVGKGVEQGRARELSRQMPGRTFLAQYWEDSPWPGEGWWRTYLSIRWPVPGEGVAA